MTGPRASGPCRRSRRRTTRCPGQQQLARLRPRRVAELHGEPRDAGPGRRQVAHERLDQARGRTAGSAGTGRARTPAGRRAASRVSRKSRTSSSVSCSRLKCVMRWFAFSVNTKPSRACSRHVVERLLRREAAERVVDLHRRELRGVVREHLPVLQALGVEDAVLPLVVGEPRRAQVEVAGHGWHDAMHGHIRGALHVRRRTGAGVGRVRRPPKRGAAGARVAHGAGAGMDHPFLVGFAAGHERARRRHDALQLPVHGGRPALARPAAVAVGTRGARRSPRRSLARGRRAGRGRREVLRRPDGARWRWPRGCRRAGLVFLGYPLHPPGKPERIRDEHLYGIQVPMLFLEGTGDPFAEPDLLSGRVVKKLGRSATLHQVEGGDHSFNVRGAKATPREVGASLAPAAAAFIGGAARPDAAQEPAGPELLRGARRAAGARPTRPPWAGLPGFDVRQVGGEKAYRCPGLRPRDPRRRLAPGRRAAGRRRTARRHWHTECWRRELRRLGPRG